MKATLLIVSLSINIQAFAIVNGLPVAESNQPEQKHLVLVPAELSTPPKNLSDFSRCSGVAVSDHEILTAGHCLRDGNTEYKPLVVYYRNGALEVIAPLTVKTEYLYETPPQVPHDGPVPGCSPGIKPFFESQTLDLAIVVYPQHSFEHFAPMDLTTTLKIGDSVTYFGFGSKYNTFITQIPISAISPEDLSKMTTVVAREGKHSFASISSPLEPIADLGDSGGAVLHENKVVGILTTYQEKCETELGEDYGFLNSFTSLSSPAVKTWLQQNLSRP